MLLGLAALPPMVQAAESARSELSITDPAQAETRVIEPGQMDELQDLIPRLADKRVIFIGESHDRYEDHLNQLGVIQGLHAQGRDLAIGMEFFQQPFQPYLDAYIAGEIDEVELLRKTEYFERWRYDYRLYRPILRFAREQGIPLIALNIERELTEKVGAGGIDSLSTEDRARIPAEFDRDNAEYRKALKLVYDMHPQRDGNFEHFLDAQLLWDESMAERAADYLREHPDKTLVVLAGVGHVEYGHGIPDRVVRRIQAPSVILINGRMRPIDGEAADYFLYPKSIDLPRTGLLGVMLDNELEEAGVGVRGFAEDSGAEIAGLKEGDVIRRIGDQEVRDYADVRIALMDRMPGTSVPVEVLRKPLVGEPKSLRFEVKLR